MVDFHKFFDSENITQEDLVAWVNVGMHHIVGDRVGGVSFAYIFFCTRLRLRTFPTLVPMWLHPGRVCQSYLSSQSHFRCPASSSPHSTISTQTYQ